MISDERKNGFTIWKLKNDLTAWCKLANFVHVFFLSTSLRFRIRTAINRSKVPRQFACDRLQLRNIFPTSGRPSRLRWAVADDSVRFVLKVTRCLYVVIGIYIYSQHIAFTFALVYAWTYVNVLYTISR